jgi:hypothetical protein
MAGYVIRQAEPGLWTVGHNEGPQWEPYADYGDQAEASAWCSHLNGGPHPDLAGVKAPDRDELDTRHMAAHLAVEHHKHLPHLSDEVSSDVALIGTAAALAAFLRDGTQPD